jgi:hypothetical protein
MILIDKRQKINFEEFLRSKTTLSEKSVLNYSQAVFGSILKWASISRIQQVSKEEEVDKLLEKIKGYPEFIQNDSRGKSMYNSALNHYKKFIKTTLSTNKNIILKQVQKVTKSKGLPRITIWNRALLDAGFNYGQALKINLNSGKVEITPTQNSNNKVSKVQNHGNTLPVIDLKETKSLQLSSSFEIGEQVTITISTDLILISKTNENAFEPTFNKDILDKRANALLKYKKREPAKGNAKPPKRKVLAIQFQRETAVVADVLDRANGICELCGKEAPFINSLGQPFLEVHHIIPLSENGPDVVDNAVGLCPNCHREAHLGANRSQITKILKQKIKINSEA